MSDLEQQAASWVPPWQRPAGPSTPDESPQASPDAVLDADHIDEEIPTDEPWCEVDSDDDPDDLLETPSAVDADPDDANDDVQAIPSALADAESPATPSTDTNDLAADLAGDELAANDHEHGVDGPASGLADGAGQSGLAAGAGAAQAIGDAGSLADAADGPDASGSDAGESSGSEAGEPDAGAPEASRPSEPDAGAPEAGGPSGPDAGAPGAGGPEAGRPSAPEAGGPSGSGAGGQSGPDAGGPEAGVPDAGGPDVGGVKAGEGEPKAPKKVRKARAQVDPHVQESVFVPVQREPDESVVDVQPLPAIAPGELASTLEAILMVVDEPASEIMLSQVLDVPAEDIAATLIELSASYTREGRGFDLRRAAGGWRFYTRADYSTYVERFVLDGQQLRLTQASLETLAVVAYRQPVTRSRISAIRGVNCDGVIRTLVTRGMVEECGADPDSGAHLYRTTNLFLEKLGLDSVEQLPPIAPFLPDNLDEMEAA